MYKQNYVEATIMVVTRNGNILALDDMPDHCYMAHGTIAL